MESVKESIDSRFEYIDGFRMHYYPFRPPRLGAGNVRGTVSTALALPAPCRTTVHPASRSRLDASTNSILQSSTIGLMLPIFMLRPWAIMYSKSMYTIHLSLLCLERAYLESRPPVPMEVAKSSRSRAATSVGSSKSRPIDLASPRNIFLPLK
jgi:hypothetical protein